MATTLQLDPRNKAVVQNLPYGPSNTTQVTQLSTPSFVDKYKANIEGLARANNVDTEAAKQMLISNLTAGGQYKGGGVLDYNAAKPDAMAYIEQAKQALQTTPTAQAQPDYSGRINSIYDQQKAAQLQQLKAQRDKAIGDINLQKQEMKPQYQNIRNQTDVGNAAAVQRLREAMAAQGLINSGDNNTEMTNLRIARENALNNTNLQEQQQINQLDKRITDINNPAQEQSLLATIEAARNQALLNELYQADQRNFRNSQFDYQKQRDQVGDQRWQTQFDYQKGRDAVGDEQWGKSFGLQEGGLTGYYNGKPTLQRENMNYDNDYRNRSLSQQAANAAASREAASARASATQEAAAAKQKAAQATSSAIAQALTYDDYNSAMNALRQYAPQMQAEGVDLQEVLNAINKRFSRPKENPLSGYMPE